MTCFANSTTMTIGTPVNPIEILQALVNGESLHSKKRQITCTTRSIDLSGGVDEPAIIEVNEWTGSSFGDL